jgi:hypothetical protein
VTTASLKPTIPSGAILTQHVKADFDDYVAGRPRVQRLCIWRGQIGSVDIKDLDKGRSEAAKYATLDMLEITDPREVDLLQRIFLRSRAEASFLARQPSLFDATEEEQRDSLIDMIRDWASEQDLPITEVDKRFVDMFGGPEHASAETVQACRSVQQLKEFAYTVGVLPDPEPGETAEEEPTGEPEPADPDEDLDEPKAEEPPTEPVKTGKGRGKPVAAPPFEPGTDD